MEPGLEDKLMRELNSKKIRLKRDNMKIANSRARFENTIMENADIRTSFNYSINPELNRVKKAKFSLSQITGILVEYDIEIDRTG